LAPQDAKHTTADLEGALAAAGLLGPYVVVGHSAGSYESLLFADRHPDAVRAMVLVDPSIPDQERFIARVAPRLSAYLIAEDSKEIAHDRRCGREVRSGRLTLGSPDPDQCLDYSPSYPTVLKQALFALVASEARERTTISLVAEFANSSRLLVNHARDLGDRPLVVLTPDDHDVFPDAPAGVVAELPAFEWAWRREHDSLAALSRHGKHKVVRGSGHYIQKDRPDAVIAAVSDVVGAIRHEAR
jgi:pimeloyl-ACP methyl ester carboxylesterase